MKSVKRLVIAGAVCVLLGGVFASIAWAAVPCMNTPGSTLIIVSTGGCIPKNAPFQAWVNTPLPNNNSNAETGSYSYTVRDSNGTPLTSGNEMTGSGGLMTFTANYQPGTYLLAVSINGKTVCEWFCVK